MRHDPPTRRNLSAELADRLREEIMTGALEPGTRLNEVHLAARWQVSRTPLREALSLLASEGFVFVAPRRGYSLPALSVEGMRELYRVRLVLDPAALAEAGLPEAAQLERLEEINLRIEAARRPVRIVDLDDVWHETLLSHLDNPLLLDVIRRFMRRTRPYEYAYMREHGHAAAAVREHRRIAAALRAGRLAAAVRALRANMESAIPALTAFLEARDGERATR